MGLKTFELDPSHFIANMTVVVADFGVVGVVVPEDLLAVSRGRVLESVVVPAWVRRVLHGEQLDACPFRRIHLEIPIKDDVPVSHVPLCTITYHLTRYNTYDRVNYPTLLGLRAALRVRLPDSAICLSLLSWPSAPSISMNLACGGCPIGRRTASYHRLLAVPLAVKAELEDYYGTIVNHGRLSPNLATLVEKGEVEKGQLDKRTNTDTLTQRGKRELTARRDWETKHTELATKPCDSQLTGVPQQRGVSLTNPTQYMERTESVTTVPNESTTTIVDVATRLEQAVDTVETQQYVVGELTDLSHSHSGHTEFDLTAPDDDATIDCVMFNSQRRFACPVSLVTLRDVTGSNQQKASGKDAPTGI